MVKSFIRLNEKFRKNLIDFYDNLKRSSIPLIMGILNVTPDSFSDGGKYFSKKSAIEQGLKLLDSGTDIIDIGGESTRPGANKVSALEEIDRVIPVIEELVKEHPDIVISIDSTKSEVAKLALEHGASIVNDISGGGFDERMYGIVASHNIPFIIMHIRGTPQDMQIAPSYENVISEISDYFESRVSMAQEEGVNKIILDPGIGFGKRIEDNYSILSNLSEFKKWDFPILIGISKKSFLGKSLNLEIDNREIATIITETIALKHGAKIIRTHNVENAIKLKKIFEIMQRNSIQYV